MKSKVWYGQVADRAVEILGVLDVDRYEEAFLVMKKETVTQNKVDARYSELSIMRDLGMVSGGDLLDKLEASLPARVVRAIQGEGIDITNTETQATLGKLRDAGAITVAEHDSLIALSKEDVFVWPGLRNGEVQNALQWRELREAGKPGGV